MMAEAKIPRFELDSADNKKADVKCELKVFVSLTKTKSF